MSPSDLAAVRGLKTYLEENLEGDFEKFYDEWPYHGDELVVPSLSIMTVGTPEYTNLMPTILGLVDDPDNSNNHLVKEMVGQYDARIQLDIWAEYKIQRSRLAELVIDALDKQRIEQDLPSGLSLVLTDYHDVIARFDYVGYTYMDSEDNSQKDQWRVKLDILVNYPKISVKSAPKISEIEVINEIGSDSDKPIEEENLDINETFEV